MSPQRGVWWLGLLAFLLTACANPTPIVATVAPAGTAPLRAATVPAPTRPSPTLAARARTTAPPPIVPTRPSPAPTTGATTTAPPTTAPRLPWLRTVENRVVTAVGAEVVLRGANILRSEWAGGMAFERRAIPHLAQDWGATVILRGFASGPVVAADPAYLALLDEHVALAAESQLYLILAYRSGSINGPIPTQPDEEAELALATLAARYRGQAHVLYALQVEPHDVTWAALRPRFERMIDAIRAAAAPGVPLVFVPGTGWSRDVSGAITDPVRRPNVVYKVHPFHDHRYNQPYFLNAHESGLPIFVGEFGDQGASTRSLMDMDDVRILLRELGERHIGYAAWIFDNEAQPALVASDADFAPTVPYGVAIREDMRERPDIPRE